MARQYKLMLERICQDSDVLQCLDMAHLDTCPYPWHGIRERGKQTTSRDVPEHSIFWRAYAHMRLLFNFIIE